MRAIILAGGRGQRLAPLTQTVPKPLVPMAGRPLIDHILALLAHHGFTDVVITLGYLGEMIRRHVGSGARFGMTVRYTEEETPLGTAGSVKKALAEYPTTAPFLVIAGDAVTDLDLFEAYCHFYAEGARIGLLLADVEDPRPYGVVALDDGGRIQRFIEKPSTMDFGRTVNTGIYYLDPWVMERVPDEHTYDFGMQLFPEWLDSGRQILGLKGEGYWCDIGTIAQYQAAHFDALRGTVRLPLLPEAHQGIRLAPSAQVDPSARLTAPVLIEEGVVIEAGSEVGPDTIIGASSRIGSWSRISRSIVGEFDSIASGAALEGAVLGSRVAVDGRASLMDRVVVGDSSRIGWGAHLHAGLRLPPGARVSPGSELFHHHGEWWVKESKEIVGVSGTA